MLHAHGGCAISVFVHVPRWLCTGCCHTSSTLCLATAQARCISMLCYPFVSCLVAHKCLQSQSTHSHSHSTAISVVLIRMTRGSSSLQVVCARCAHSASV